MVFRAESLRFAWFLPVVLSSSLPRHGGLGGTLVGLFWTVPTSKRRNKKATKLFWEEAEEEKNSQKYLHLIYSPTLWKIKLFFLILFCLQRHGPGLLPSMTRSLRHEMKGGERGSSPHVSERPPSPTPPTEINGTLSLYTHVFFYLLLSRTLLRPPSKRKKPKLHMVEGSLKQPNPGRVPFRTEGGASPLLKSIESPIRRYPLAFAKLPSHFMMGLPQWRYITVFVVHTISVQKCANCKRKSIGKGGLEILFHELSEKYSTTSFARKLLYHV